MINRIEKTREAPEWGIQASTGTKKDKKKQSEEEKQEEEKEPQSKFEEKVDLGRLITKETQAAETVRVLSRDVKHFVFKAINHRKDHSIVEGNLVFKDGTEASGHISVPHSDALHFKSMQSGVFLPPETFGKDPYLRVSIAMAPRAAEVLTESRESSLLELAAQSEEDEVTEIKSLGRLDESAHFDALSRTQFILKLAFIGLIALAIYLVWFFFT